MKIIIDGDYNKELVSTIKSKDLPVSHIIIHAPHNPIGNSSIFLPEQLPTIEEFESYTKFVQDEGLIPIVGIDSTCQGNFEGHIKQYKAVKQFFENILGMGYKNILVGSPNNIGLVKSNYPSLKIYTSYSQFVTSLNRAKLFFEMGSNSIILHPDIIRYSVVLENLLKVKPKNVKSDIEYIIPLNLGCNWGCMHWYQHHNLQSHRTMNSPLLPNQASISNVEDGFDFSVLSCWKRRLEHPEQILKSGWISPYNISKYEKIGYNNFLLSTFGFTTKKTISIIESYMNNSFKGTFNEILNIPKPYGKYWPKDTIEEAMLQLEDKYLSGFSKEFPIKSYYPFEDMVDKICDKYLKIFNLGNIPSREKGLSIINQKLEKLERGAINE